MQCISEKLGTLISAMAIENCKITDWNFRVDSQILNALVRVLHAFSLTYITHNTSVEPLNLKFQRPNPKCIVRLQYELFSGIKPSVDTT